MLKYWRKSPGVLIVAVRGGRGRSPPILTHRARRVNEQSHTFAGAELSSENSESAVKSERAGPCGPPATSWPLSPQGPAAADPCGESDPVTARKPPQGWRISRPFGAEAAGAA